MRFKKIGFIGMGLIGGSIAKKLKKENIDISLFLLSRSERTLKCAYDSGLTDNSSNMTLEEIAKCDLVILCAPVRSNLDYMRKLRGILGENTLVTDVGSTKSDIHAVARELLMEDHFIGGHPMAGTEKIGIDYSDPELFFGANYVLTPTESSKEVDLEDLTGFVRILGAKPLVIDYRRHDEAASAISHLPHMLSYALTDLVREMDNDGLMKKMAAGGFRDMTRVASSSPQMWSNICISNGEIISEQIDEFIDRLKMLQIYIDKGDSAAIEEIFTRARDYKEKN